MKNCLKWISSVSCALALAAFSVAAQQAPEKSAALPDSTVSAPYQWSDIGEPVYQGGGSMQPPISHGKPRDVHVLRGLGLYGLDDDALQAVEKYRFKPALEDGKPVAVHLNVEVNFIYGGPR